ncbi:ABC transporter permease [Bacteroidota bacterium]
MIFNYLKIALRNIRKYKVYSVLNIAGLALGISCCIFILLWVQDELSFDRFNENADNLYRVEEDQYYSGETYHVNVTPFPVAPVFIDEIPEISNAARITWHGILLKFEDKSFYETDVVAVDPSYLEMFTIDFIRGNKSTVLDDPYSIIINEEIAEKYFGETDPIGKVVSINNEYDFRVTGVFKKMPHNTTYNFEIGFQFEFLKEFGRWNEGWGSNSIYTFVQLFPGSNISSVNEKMTNLLRLNEPESTTDYLLAPITGLHLYSYWGYGKPTGAIQYVYIFSIIAIFVLIIACINFMNLATAKSSNRAKEIGMRKVVGARRLNLINQFFGESLLLAFLGLFFALIIVILLFSEFKDFTGKELNLNILIDPKIILGLLIITLITGILAGSYPALYLSSFRPVNVLKNVLKIGTRNTLFRRILVVFQFSLSVFLIIGTIIIYNQLVFMRNKSLGYDKEQLLYIRLRGDLTNSYQTIRNSLKRTAGVINVSGSNHRPHQIGSNSGGAEWDGKDPEQTVLIGTNYVDFNYTKTMGVDIIEGRGFSEEFPADVAIDSTGNFLVNEEVVKIMDRDYKSAIGARFKFMGIEGKIIGIMRNFHYNSVRTKIEPLAMIVNPDQLYYLAVRIAPGDISSTLDNIKNTWKDIIPNFPLEYRFVEEDFERYYTSEQRMVKLLRTFSILAIIIACLGLFGLASFTAEQKTKEIGIRKTLGASEYNLIYLLCREFLGLVIIAAIISFPVSYFLLEQWLENFAYRIELGVFTFLLSGLMALVIALLTVGYQAVKAAFANPIDALRYE